MLQIRFAGPAALFLLATMCLGECRKARPGDVPQGANEFIVLRKQTVTRVSGTVFLPDHQPAGDVVVEVYRDSGKLEPPESIHPPRLTACITSDDGKFSFPKIKPGKYALRVGARTPAGLNETLVPIVVRRFWLPGKGSTLKVKLALGT